jgi:hypothetical protein
LPRRGPNASGMDSINKNQREGSTIASKPTRGAGVGGSKRTPTYSGRMLSGSHGLPHVTLIANHCGLNGCGIVCWAARQLPRPRHLDESCQAPGALWSPNRRAWGSFWMARTIESPSPSPPHFPESGEHGYADEDQGREDDHRMVGHRAPGNLIMSQPNEKPQPVCGTDRG